MISTSKGWAEAEVIGKIGRVSECASERGFSINTFGILLLVYVEHSNVRQLWATKKKWSGGVKLEREGRGHQITESSIGTRPVTEFVCFSNTFDVNTEHVSGLDFNAVPWRIAAVELSKPNSSFGWNQNRCRKYTNWKHHIHSLVVCDAREHMWAEYMYTYLLSFLFHAPIDVF